MSHVSKADIKESTETLTSEMEPSSSKGPPTKKKKPGPLSKLLGDIFTKEKSDKNTTDHARNELV